MSAREEVSARHRNGLIVGLSVGAALAMGLALVGYVSILWPLLIVYYVYLRMIRVRRFVLWFRRFTNEPRNRFPFGSLLANTCSGFCIPITIQDSVFHTSYISSMSRVLLVAPVVTGLGLFAMLFAGFASILVLAAVGNGNGPRVGDYVAVAVVTLLTGAGYAVLMWRQFVRRGFVTLKRERAQRDVRHIVDSIRERKSGFMGVLVLKTPDDVWQDVVRTALDRASAVIIDVTEFTDNLEWELKAALAKYPPEAIVLAAATPAADRDRFPPDVAARIRHLVGEVTFERLKRFCYPDRQTGLPIFHRQSNLELSNRLFALLARAMVARSGSPLSATQAESAKSL